MADEIRGFTIDLGLDTSDIDRGLANLERKLKTADAQMEANLSTFDKAERSIDKYETELDGLNKKQEQQARINEQAQKKLDQLRNAQDKTTQALKEAGAQVEATNRKYGRLENEFTQINNKLNAHKKAVKDAQTAQKSEQNTLTAMTAGMKNAKSNVDALSDELNQLQTSGKGSEKEIEQLKNKLASAQAELKSFSNSVDNSKRKLNESKMATAQAKNELDSFSNENKEAATNAKVAMDAAAREAKKAENAYASLERQVGRLPSEIDKAEAKVYEEALAFNVLQNRIDETTDEMRALNREQMLLSATSRMMGNAWGGANSAMSKIANTLRSVGEITQGTIAGIVVQQISSIVPIAGSAVNAIAGIGGAATAVAGGAIGMAGVYGTALGAVSLFAGQAKTALSMLEDGQIAVTSQVRNYQTAVSGLKAQWQGMVRANQAAIFNTMANGINIARTAITRLTPFITQTTNQIARASAKMRDWVTSSRNAQNAFKMINNIGPPIFQNVLNAAMRVGDGLTNIFTQFGPLFSWVGAGVESLANKFNAWANSTSTNNGIAQFINYTKVNLPIVGQIFGNIFGGIIGLFQAFSGQSHTVLQAMQSVTATFRDWGKNLKGTEGFKNFIAYLNTNGPHVWQLLKNLGSIFIQLVQGMAPVGAMMLKLSMTVTGFISSLMQAHPMIGKVVGAMTALAGTALLIGKPFFILRGALLGATGATTLFGEAGALAGLRMRIASAATAVWRAMIISTSTVMNVWRGQTALMTVVTGKYSMATKLAAIATRGLGLAIRFMSGPIGWIITGIGALVTAIVLLWKNNATFRNAVILAWSAIKATAISVFGFLKVYIVTVWNAIKTASIMVWNGLKAAAISTWNGIKFAVQHPIQSLKIILTGLWTGIKMGAIAIWNGLKISAIAIWNGIKNGVMFVVKHWKQILFAQFYIMRAVIPTVFRVIKTVVVNVWNSMKNTVVRVAKALWTGVKATFHALSVGVHTIFNGVKNFAVKVWTSLKNGVIARAKALWTGVRVAFNALNKGVHAIFNAVKNFGLKLWTNFKNGVVARAKALWSGVRATFNTLNKGVHNIFNSVKNFALKLWTNLKNGVVSRAKALWNGVKNNFNALSKSVHSIFNALRSFAIRLWNNLKNKIVNLAKNIWDGVRVRFNGLWNSTKSIFNKLKGFAINTWNAIKNRLIGFANSIKDKVTGAFGKMRDSLKGIIGKIKGFIGDMVDGVKKGLNKLIDGVNWVAGKLGMDKLPKIKLHTGTEHTNTTTNVVKNGKIARDTFATVGDKGKGNGPGGFRHEAIRYPNGKVAITPNRDTTAYLPQGSTVYNGAQTHAMLSQSTPQFSMGTIPRFASGTKKKKKHWYDSISDAGAKTVGKFGAKAIDTGHGIKEGTQKALEEAGKVAKGAFSKIGDVMDYAEHPGKLVDKVISAAGVNFDWIKGSLPAQMMKGMFGKLKKGVADFFSQGFDDQGGGDASKLLRYKQIQGFGRYTGGLSFNGGRHYGIDLAYPSGSNVYATNDGVLSSLHDYGGGNVARLLMSKFTLYFMHLSKILKHGRVKAGELIAKSGGTGAFTTGPHLHFQVDKGRQMGGVNNAAAIDPLKWLKGHGGGGTKSGKKWASTIKQALKMNGLPTTSAYVNAWARQIDSESSGNPNATQGVSDVNSGGNEARGLVQVTPKTFASMKFKGHGNITNPLDNLLAGIHWAKSAYGKNMLSVIGHGHGYATGGLIKNSGMYNIAEGGYPEYVISTDPKRRTDSMKLLALASQEIDKGKTSGNKRPHQLGKPSVQSSGSDPMLEKVVENQNVQISQLQNMVDNLVNLVSETIQIKNQPKGFSERDVSQAQGKKAQMMNWNMGGAF
ncbi:peptidoglycan DD-metalloendopeptidase family protein [Staphylococcus kloosii]|uniref:peptidoglycan DD-metalloendopeptidase family protein n=1 Tax=Staphylococcus kloosii TaxID=29384 RepID=UPI00189C702C|nr:peptidoglycan DD-metalloendopeptidase family protein [Staphylococcus kloosii]MBF7029657.1 peptidoglycan DD-metalloendopeptidase family protein [Staphylococcus kloosii]